MSYETVEAVQCHLPGLGYILYPKGIVTPAPERIDDTYIYTEDCRVFEKPNPNGPLYEYKRDEPGKCWWKRETD